MRANTTKRSDQTRQELMAAFTRLVFANGFEHVSVRRIASEADLARSTFYEHFSSKEDLLRACMAQFLSVIAECVRNAQIPQLLPKVLDHLWENRRLTDAIFSGPARIVLARTLGEMVEMHLRELKQGERMALPYRLAAIHVAEGQLALVENWMRGRAFCTTEALGEALHRSSRASAGALLA